MERSALYEPISTKREGSAKFGIMSERENREKKAPRERKGSRSEKGGHLAHDELGEGGGVLQDDVLSVSSRR